MRLLASRGAPRPVDANLRPEGKPGRWCAPWPATGLLRAVGQTWEFQALLKARPVAGDLALGAGVRRGHRARWSGGRGARGLRRGRAGDAPPGRGAHPGRPGRPAAQARPRRPARRRVRGPAAAAGARPHRRVAARGRRPSRRSRRCRGRLRRPRRRGELDRGLPLPARCSSTGSSCTGCAAPTCPADDDAADLRWLARAAGCVPTRAATPSGELQAELRAAHRARCAGCTRSSSTGRCSTRWPGCRASELRAHAPSGARAARALGFLDPDGALRHMAALTAGRSRARAIQRTLLPVLLDWFADAADPDAGLLAFRQVSEALGDHAVVPAAAARRGRGRRAAGPRARHQPVRRRPAPARAGGAADPRRRRPDGRR